MRQKKLFLAINGNEAIRMSLENKHEPLKPNPAFLWAVFNVEQEKSVFGFAVVADQLSWNRAWCCIVIVIHLARCSDRPRDWTFLWQPRREEAVTMQYQARFQQEFREPGVRKLIRYSKNNKIFDRDRVLIPSPFSDIAKPTRRTYVVKPAISEGQGFPI
jgi:hypothetical protein